MELRDQIVYAILNFDSCSAGPLLLLTFLPKPLLVFPGCEELGLSGAWDGVSGVRHGE